MAQDCIAEGSIHQNSIYYVTHDRMTFDEVLIAVHTGLQRAKDEFLQSDSVVVRKEPPFYYESFVPLCACLMNIHRVGMELFIKLFTSPIPKVFADASLELARNAVR